MIHRKIILSLVALILAGCEAPQVKDCESKLLDRLKSPSSYKRVSADSFAVDTAKSPYQAVIIEYDAVNSFNAPLRDKEYCTYRIRDGRATLEEFDAFGSDADLSAAAEAADKALDAAAQAVEDAGNAVDSASTVDNAAENEN
jgi:hypothetical protein